MKYKIVLVKNRIAWGESVAGSRLRCEFFALLWRFKGWTRDEKWDAIVCDAT